LPGRDGDLTGDPQAGEQEGMSMELAESILAGVVLLLIQMALRALVNTKWPALAGAVAS
jgi:hypothetical protein